MNEKQLHKANSAVHTQQGANRRRRERTATGPIKNQIPAIESAIRAEKPESTPQEVRFNLRHDRGLKRGQWRSRLRAIPRLFKYARYGGLSARVRSGLAKRQPRQGLYLWGITGNGKSYTVCAVARQLVLSAQVVTVERVRYDELLKEMRACYHDAASQADIKVLQKYQSPDLLIIEDVGVTTCIGGQESDFSLTTLYLLVDWRLENMKPTFITSNKNLKNLTDSFDARIGSRLSTYRVIELERFDRRRVDA